MKLPLRMTGTVLLLMLSMGSAFADRGHNRRDERDAQRSEQYLPPQDRQQARGQNAQGGNPPDAAPQAPRRRNMTPEERRALRQQIHEAGREIYTPPNR